MNNKENLSTIIIFYSPSILIWWCHIHKHNKQMSKHMKFLLKVNSRHYFVTCYSHLFLYWWKCVTYSPLMSSVLMNVHSSILINLPEAFKSLSIFYYVDNAKTDILKHSTKYLLGRKSWVKPMKKYAFDIIDSLSYRMFHSMSVWVVYE